MVGDPAKPPDNVDALKRMVVDMAQDAIHARTLIEKLRFELARLKRQQFGALSEKLDSQVGQLELAIQAIETDTAERTAETVPEVAVEESADIPARRTLPGHLPREDVIYPRSLRLSGLRRQAAPDRRGRHRDSRLCARPLKGSAMCAAPSRAGLVTRSCKRRRSSTRSPVAAPDRGFWPTSWWPSSTTTFSRAIVKPRSSPAKASPCRPQQCRAGSERLRRLSCRLSTCCGVR